MLLIYHQKHNSKPFTAEAQRRRGKQKYFSREHHIDSMPSHLFFYLPSIEFLSASASPRFKSFDFTIQSGLRHFSRAQYRLGLVAGFLPLAGGHRVGDYAGTRLYI